MTIDPEKAFNAMYHDDMKLFCGYLDMGVDINYASPARYKRTFLTHAIREEKTEFVRELMKRNARIDIPDEKGVVPFYYILNSSSSRASEFLRLFLEAGADPFALDKSGNNAFEIFRSKSDNFYWDRDTIKSLLYSKIEKKEQVFNREPPKPPAEAALTVIFNRAAGSHDIEEVYLFETKERVTYYHKPGSKVLETATRETFASLGDQPSLRAAFDEHVKLGGQLTEEDVFRSGPSFGSVGWALPRKG